MHLAIWFIYWYVHFAKVQCGIRIYKTKKQWYTHWSQSKRISCKPKNIFDYYKSLPLITWINKVYIKYAAFQLEMFGFYNCNISRVQMPSDVLYLISIIYNICIKYLIVSLRVLRYLIPFSRMQFLQNKKKYQIKIDILHFHTTQRKEANILKYYRTEI